MTPTSAAKYALGGQHYVPPPRSRAVQPHFLSPNNILSLFDLKFLCYHLFFDELSVLQQCVVHSI